MIKKILAVFLSGCLLFGLCGCQKKDATEDRFKDETVLFDASKQESVSSSQDSTPSSESAESSESENPSDSGEGKPRKEEVQLVQTGEVPTPDVNEMFVLAERIYRDLTHYTFGIDPDLGAFPITVDGETNSYFRVHDKRFDSVEELENYLNALFTESCRDTFYEKNRFADHDGHLYAIIGAVAENPLYAGYSLKLQKQTTMRIMFDATVYSYKSYEDLEAAEAKDPFVGVPEDASAYDTATVSYTMEIGEDGMTWRFSEFSGIR